MQSREHLNSWQQLTKHAQQMKNEHMKDLFAADKLRFNKFSIKLPSILLDYSKNTITEQTLLLLTDLAKECDVETWREKMFTGVRINKTEDRAVLHTALRNNSKTPMMVDGNDISQDIENNNILTLQYDKVKTYNPKYSAPEILLGKKPNKESDIFSFAFEDFEILNYQSHPHIKAAVAV